KKMKIKSIWGNFSIPSDIHEDTSTMERADLIIISSKITKPEEDVKKYNLMIKKIIKKDSSILVLQNGINIEEYLSKFFPKNPIMGGLAFTCINREKKGNINHLDYGLIKIGALNSNYNSLTKRVVELFLSAGIETSYSTNLRRARYEKLLWNVPFNTLSVICYLLTDGLISSKYSKKLSEELMKEVKFLAESEGIKIKNKDIHSMIDKTEKMKPYKTSMYLDYLNKNPLETDVILGELLKISKKQKVDIPRIETVYLILKRLEEKYL
ncbi:MAG: 2-dehydropantoate 2-reductase, partial [Leptospiraceae bacterium]|nr:2-dehydropantoate 2-reductase [Leptospiraceae bacterium]